MHLVAVRLLSSIAPAADSKGEIQNFDRIREEGRFSHAGGLMNDLFVMMPASG